MTGFVPESPIFSSLQFLRLLGCVPLRRGFPQGARRKNLAGSFFKKNLPWGTALNFGQRRWQVRVEASGGARTCDAPCILGGVLDSAFMQDRVRLSCSDGLIYTGRHTSTSATPHIHEHLPRNFSTVPQWNIFCKNHPAKFFLRAPWGKPLLRGTQPSNRKNWRLEKIGDSGTKPVILKYCNLVDYNNTISKMTGFVPESPIFSSLRFFDY